MRVIAGGLSALGPAGALVIGIGFAAVEGAAGGLALAAGFVFFGLEAAGEGFVRFGVLAGGVGVVGVEFFICWIGAVVGASSVWGRTGGG